MQEFEDGKIEEKFIKKNRQSLNISNEIMRRCQLLKNEIEFKEKTRRYFVAKLFLLELQFNIDKDQALKTSNLEDLATEIGKIEEKRQENLNLIKSSMERQGIEILA